MDVEELKRHGTGKSTRYKAMRRAWENKSPYLEAKTWARLVTNIEMFMCKACVNKHKCGECILRFDIHEMPTHWSNKKSLFRNLYVYRQKISISNYIRRRSYKPDVIGRMLLRIRELFKR